MEAEAEANWGAGEGSHLQILGQAGPECPADYPLPAKLFHTQLPGGQFTTALRGQWGCDKNAQVHNPSGKTSEADVLQPRSFQMLQRHPALALAAQRDPHFEVSGL